MADTLHLPTANSFWALRSRFWPYVQVPNQFGTVDNAARLLSGPDCTVVMDAPCPSATRSPLGARYLDVWLFIRHVFPISATGVGESRYLYFCVHLFSLKEFVFTSAWSLKSIRLQLTNTLVSCVCNTRLDRLSSLLWTNNDTCISNSHHEDFIALYVDSVAAFQRQRSSVRYVHSWRR